MSVWEELNSLSTYACTSVHVVIVRRRREWFERIPEAYAVPWRIPRDHRPTTLEARERLKQLRVYGATPRAFTFKDAHDPPDFADTCRVLARPVAGVESRE